MAQQVGKSISETDPRIYVEGKTLRALAGPSRAISLLPRQPARSLLNGRHASCLRGRGLNFEELRNYLPGDDPRTIDWRVTARTGTPYVRVYSEERDRPGLVLVDQRMSMFFGSVAYMKSVVAAEAAAIVAHRLLGQGDRIGGLVFGDALISEHRPRRSATTLTQFLTALATGNRALHAGWQPPELITIDEILKRALKLMPQSGLVVLISDFDGLTVQSEPLLRQLSQRGDLILIHVSDPASQRLMNKSISISDGGLQANLDLSDPALRARVQASFDTRLTTLMDLARKYRFPVLPLSTDQPALAQMIQLFGLRRRLG